MSLFAGTRWRWVPAHRDRPGMYGGGSITADWVRCEDGEWDAFKVAGTIQMVPRADADPMTVLAQLRDLQGAGDG